MQFSLFPTQKQLSTCLQRFLRHTSHKNALFLYFVQIPPSGYVGLVVLDAGGARGRLAGDSRLLQSRLDHPDLLVLTSRSSVQEHSLHSTKNTVKTYGFVQFPFSDHVPNKKTGLFE